MSIFIALMAYYNWTMFIGDVERDNECWSKVGCCCLNAGIMQRVWLYGLD